MVLRGLKWQPPETSAVFSGYSTKDLFYLLYNGKDLSKEDSVTTSYIIVSPSIPNSNVGVQA